MIVDGEKYACDACVRGHRVSSCTHKDRKLNHVNKKGRPLTQCPHCRGLRKSRASHVKCECGELGHSRNSSVESTSEVGCQCRNGKRCTCALKKEPIDPAASKRTLGRLPGINSDSAVPKLKAPLPPHRGHFYGSDNSRGYPIGQAPHNVDNLHMHQRSADHLRRPAPIPFQQASPHLQHVSPQPSSQPLAARQYSNPMQSTSVAQRRRAQLPALRINDQTHLPDFSESVDQSTLSKALSPGNPARYSFHGGMSQDTAAQPSRFSNSDVIHQQNSHWQNMNMAASYDPRASYLNYNPMTPSDVSVDYSHSSQLGLSMSSSGTPSEPGDANGNSSDMISQPLPYRPLQNHPAYLHNEAASKSDVGLHDWQSFPVAAYAVSDPGEPPSNWQSQMSNLDFAFADTENDHVLDQNMGQYPTMTDEVVRDWVVEPPSQMQDPNLGHYSNYPSYTSSMPQAADRFPTNPGWI